ncbi:MAG: phage head closure protein [Sphingomonas sp.]|nr:phage head closure protein [Sphingomonas sp.]
MESTPNGSGGFSSAWVPLMTVWAEVIALRGGEALVQNVQRSTQLFRVTIRHRSDVTTANRLLFEGRPMNIISCEDVDGRREALVMTTETGVRT